MELKKSKFTNVITKITPDSIAEELDIQKGDFLIAVNDNEIEDIIQYKYLIAEEYVELYIRTKDGEDIIFEIDKEIDEDIGIEFENPIINSISTCNNKCMFCFIDQLPKGMRETLYIKDDDSRLSFLQGNFITMTNMKEKDIQRMIDYKISPVNVSVHTTDPKLRVKMLKNKFAGEILNNMTKLKDANIRMNAQIVLIPEVNDKENLDRTITDLYGLYPQLQSIAIVPVGITKHRENLPKLKIFNQTTSSEVIDQISKYNQKFKKEIGTNFVFLSDEFYIMAKRELPKYEYYEDFAQLENGVGMMRRLINQFNKALENQTDKIKNRKVSLATGSSAYEIIKQLADKVSEKYPNIETNVYKITNNFFGETITVAGLITAHDLKEQLKGKELGDELLLPSTMFKADGEKIFLDSITLEELEEYLKVKIAVTENDGEDLLNKIIGKK